MKRRSYRSEQDIILLQDFNAAPIKKSGGCGYLHPGDIAHHFFSGNKTMDPREICSIWEDDMGVAAWILASPKYRGFDAQVRPDVRTGDFEREVLKYAEEETLKFMKKYGFEGKELGAEACQCDHDRSRVLIDLGWTLDTEAEYVLNRRPLQDIPDPVLADGYTIRTVRGPEEAEAVVKLHLDVFTTSGWTVELYRTYMEKPGYEPEREYLAVDPQGQLAAFTVTWLDELNKTVLFEPVGTHPDHRRKGLARALLCIVMQDLKKKGFKTALVQNEGANGASRDLYLGMGFKPWQREDSFIKKVGKSL